MIINFVNISRIYEMYPPIWKPVFELAILFASSSLSSRSSASLTDNLYSDTVPDRGLGHETEKPSKLTAGVTRSFSGSIFGGIRYKERIFGIEVFSIGSLVFVVAMRVMNEEVRLVNVTFVASLDTLIGPFGITL